MRKVNSSPCLSTASLASQNPSITIAYNNHQSHMPKSISCSALLNHYIVPDVSLEENPAALVSSSISQYVTCIETNGFPEDIFKNGTSDSKLNLMACLLSPDDQNEQLRNLKPKPIDSEIEIESEINSISEEAEHFNRLLIRVRKQRRNTKT